MSNRPPCCLEPSEVGKTHPTTTELSSRRARLNRVFVSAWINPDQSSLVVALPCVLPPTRTVLTPLADCSTTSSPQQSPRYLCELHRRPNVTVAGCGCYTAAEPFGPTPIILAISSLAASAAGYVALVCFSTLEVGGQSDTIACNCRQPLWPPAVGSRKSPRCSKARC